MVTPPPTNTASLNVDTPTKVDAEPTYTPLQNVVNPTKEAVDPNPTVAADPTTTLPLKVDTPSTFNCFENNDGPFDVTIQVDSIVKY